MRTILVKDSSGEFKIEIPLEAHLTFGPDVPFEEKSHSYGKKQYSLRVYLDQTKKSLLAVFSGVEWFRDLNIKHARLVIREEGKSMWKSDEDGYEVQQSAKTRREFVDSARLIGAGQTTTAKKTTKKKRT